jgi:hypothetical protein
MDDFEVPLFLYNDVAGFGRYNSSMNSYETYIVTNVEVSNK